MDIASLAPIDFSSECQQLVRYGEPDVTDHKCNDTQSQKQSTRFTRSKFRGLVPFLLRGVIYTFHRLEGQLRLESAREVIFFAQEQSV